MSNRIKIIYLSTILIISTLVAIFLWKYINLPIDKTLIGYEGTGQKNYHTHTDTLRFFLFICISLLPFLFFYLRFYQKESIRLNEIFFLKLKKHKSNDLNLFLNLFLILVIFNFLIFNFSSLITEIDIFHEGLWLTPSSNYNFTKLFWSSSFIERGLGGNYFPLLMWGFMGENNIGTSRLSSILFLMGNKILLVLLAEKISRNIELEKTYKIIFFVLLSVTFISFVSYDDTSHIGRRFFIFLLFLNIFFNSLSLANKISLNNYLLGVFSLLGILWFLDIGIYINILITFFIFFLLLRKEYKSVVSILIGLISAWIIFYNLISKEEFQFFIENTFQIGKLIEQVGSIQYPLPFFDQNTRSTKILIFFIIAGIFVINISLNKKSKFSNNSKIFLIALYIMSLITFKYALGRSDDPHIKAASGLLLLIISVMVIHYFIYYLQILNRKYSLNKEIIKKSLYALFFFLIFHTFELNKFKNIIKTKSNIKELINAKDSSFLINQYKEYNDLIKYYNNISEKDDCIQIFTDEAALPYLIKKKTCTKYYVMMTGSPREIQLDFINELKQIKPKIILYKSEKFEYEPISSRIKLVNNFINKNYVLYEKFMYWTFLKLKN